MERAFCEQCGQRQPPEWRAGEFCTACGAAVRREIRCAWCAEWTPSGKFCRGCGGELIEPEQYGAARMLKSAGVDRFALAQRLRELEVEQRENLERIYESQLAVVTRRVEETRFCERFLLQKDFGSILEEALIPTLPLEKGDLAALAVGPSGPFNDGPELLSEIAAQSPLEHNRALASIALLRLGRINQEVLKAVGTALSSNHPQLAIEAALGLAHWRVKAYPDALWRSEYYDRWRGIDPRRVADIALTVPVESFLAPWAAAAWVLAAYGRYGKLPDPSTVSSPEEVKRQETFRSLLRAGLDRGDPDLHFTCALGLGEMDIVAAGLDSRDKQMQDLARRYLAKHNSPAVAGCLSNGSTEVQKEILDDLSTPLPSPLVEPVLQVVERGDAEIRKRGARLLQRNLSTEIVDRLVKVARRKNDREVFQALLNAEELPEGNVVVHAVIDEGMLSELRSELIPHIDFADQVVIRLATRGGPDVLETLLHLADWQLQRDQSGWTGPDGERPTPRTAPPRTRATGRFLTGVAFGAYPPASREEAFSRLEYYDGTFWDWLGQDGVRELFGGAPEFFRALAGVFQELELHNTCYRVVAKLQERIADLVSAGRDAPAPLGELVKTLTAVVTQDYANDTVLQTMVVELLLKLAPAYPAEIVRIVITLLKDHRVMQRGYDIPRRIVDGYTGLRPHLAKDKSALAELVGALLDGIDAMESSYYNQVEILAELLDMVKADFPKTRPPIAARLARLENSFSLPTNLREMVERAIRETAPAPSEQAEQETAVEAASAGAALPTLEHLDHEVLMPDDAFPTLAEYVAFLKAIGATRDPMAVMQQYGLSQERYLKSVEDWSQLVCSRDDVAIRYGQLLADNS